MVGNDPFPESFCKSLYPVENEKSEIYKVGSKMIILGSSHTPAVFRHNENVSIL